jgi:hypothetical protein
MPAPDWKEGMSIRKTCAVGGLERKDCAEILSSDWAGLAALHLVGLRRSLVS